MLKIIDFIKKAACIAGTLLLSCVLCPFLLIIWILGSLISILKCFWEIFKLIRLGKLRDIGGKLKLLWQNIKQRWWRNEYYGKFFDFTPINNVRNNPSFGALDYALNGLNRLVHNVAISGPYGAGKSSLWLSYTENRLPKTFLGQLVIFVSSRIWLPRQSRVLNLSLAKFDDENKDSKEEKKYNNCVVVNNTNEKSEKQGDANINACNVNDCEDDDERIEYQIEKSILQQILFSVEKEKIPYVGSYKFSTVFNLFFVLISVAIGFFGFLYLSVYLTQSVIQDKLKTYYDGVFYDHFLTVICVTLAIALCALSYRILKRLDIIHVKAFTIKNLTVSFDEHAGSLINQNYAAIVYFFEKTKKKIVVLEDIDRFSSNQIFVKLRELNELLNNCPKLKNDIKFVYMVKENLFSKYQRTKFFDMIVPVVSAVNMDSCADLILSLKSQKDKYPELQNLKSDFVNEIGRFINDNRMVKDLINEFIIYCNQLKDDLKNEVDVNVDQNIFAMIVYKNYYPKDFMLFHRHKGVLWRILQNYQCGKLVEEIKSNGNFKFIREEYCQKTRENTLHDVFDCKHDEDKACEEWIKWQCLKLELDIDDEEKSISDDDNANLQRAINSHKESLLFTMLKNNYIGTDCEFYTSRKYLGSLGIVDYKYLMAVKSDGKPLFDLDIQKPRLIEQKILDHQWASVSALNYRMFAYELYSAHFDKEPKKYPIVRDLVKAMCKAEKNHLVFFDEFVNHLEKVYRDKGFSLEDEVLTIKDGIQPILKDLFFEAIFDNMDENTLFDLFGR